MNVPRGFYLSSNGDMKDISQMNFNNTKNAVLKIRREGMAEERATEIEDLIDSAKAKAAAWDAEHPDDPATDMAWVDG